MRLKQGGADEGGGHRAQTGGEEAAVKQQQRRQRRQRPELKLVQRARPQCYSAISATRGTAAAATDRLSPTLRRMQTVAGRQRRRSRMTSKQWRPTG